MTRKEYMEQLRKYLKRLPKEDYENAIEYFSEYFDEAGPENEQQVMEELGLLLLALTVWFTGKILPAILRKFTGFCSNRLNGRKAEKV